MGRDRDWEPFDCLSAALDTGCLLVADDANGANLSKHGRADGVYLEGNWRVVATLL